MILENLAKMDSFTHQEKAAARYILDHVELIQKMSAEELAKASFTSKATVVRLCKKLGVEGYQELKYNLVSEMVENIRVNQLLSKEPITEKSSYNDIVTTLPKLYDKAITDTKLCMDKNVMLRIANRIRQTDRLDIYGSGISYILAQSAAFKFSTLGMECTAYESVNAHYLVARKKKKSVSFLITFTGANLDMIGVARYLKETSGTYVVGIVGRHNDEIRKWCDEIVEIPSRDSLLSLKVVTSFTATTYVLDIFFSMFLSQTYEEHVKSSLEMVCHESLRTAVDYWSLK
ncbi:MurR/RpiR family transcriptional regulator [Lacrimispora sp.]|jgi:DNA-binding MurR/RpiR family transcriptional regulator|uniref:MurR/RpiR family transcriptional regulator n=1 Tax=Lacrimispora sp. TaxID=2719234 RepID=UPI0028ABA5EE|nr:MurR/RpiR family transcriptional regulator [Lacrimispora sp.]